MDDAGEQALEGGVLFGEGEVGPDLGGGIAQPHGVDIACDDEGVGLALEGAGADGGVERVGEAVLEHPGEFGVGDEFFDFEDAGFDGGAGEFALGEGRALGGVGVVREQVRGGEGEGCGGGEEGAASGGHG